MQLIMPVAFMLVVLLLAVLLRPWLRVRTVQGELDRTRTNLRVLAVLSWLALALGATLPILSKVEGKKTEPRCIAYLFIGMIGLSIYQIISQLLKRISELERRADLPETRPSRSAEKTT